VEEMKERMEAVSPANIFFQRGESAGLCDARVQCDALYQIPDLCDVLLQI